MDKASALPPYRHRIKAERLSAAEGFHNNSVWAIGLETRPIAAGFVFSALNHTSPIHIYRSASLCATLRSPFHCKLAYIHRLILISCSVGSIKAKANELHTIMARCSLPPVRGLYAICPSAEPPEPAPQQHVAADSLFLRLEIQGRASHSTAI